MLRNRDLGPGYSGTDLGGSARPQVQTTDDQCIFSTMIARIFQVQGKLGSGAKVGHGGTLDPFATGVHASNFG